MAKRVVRKGQGLIVRQQTLIDGMIADGCHSRLPAARAILATLQEAQQLNEKHLARHAREDRRRMGEIC